MSDQAIERRLRLFYQTQIDDSVRAPATLRAAIATIPLAASRPGSSNRRFTLMAAAALLATSLIAIYIGSSGGQTRSDQPIVSLGPPISVSRLGPLDVARRDKEVLMMAGVGLDELLAFNPTTGTLRPLVPNASIAYAAWSSDGTKLAFEVRCGQTASDTDVNDACARDRGYWVADASGSVLQIASFPTDSMGPDIQNLRMELTKSVSWSTDGSRLAFIYKGIWMLTLGPDMGAPVLISGTEGRDSSLCCTRPFLDWSPDGSTLFFMLQSGDEVNVYRASADGLEAATLLVPNTSAAALSPSGEQLAVASDHAFAFVDVATGLASEFASTDGWMGNALVWSSDGERVAYDVRVDVDVQRRTDWELWVASPDGSLPIRVVGAHVEQPTDPLLAWSPDGAQLAISRLGIWDGWHLAAADGSEDGKGIADLRTAPYVEILGWEPCLCTLQVW